MASIGNTWSRILLAFLVIFWSGFAKVWLDLTFGWLLTGMLGVYTVVLTVTGIKNRTVELDKTLFKMWSCWLVSFSILPLVKVVERSFLI